MTSAAEDLRFMHLALTLGRRGLGNAWPNPAVGAVIVRDGVVVGRGWTQAGGRPHAEVEALRRAREAAKGATMYVTLEPCSHFGKTPPCVDAIIAAGLSRIVSAIVDPNPDVAGQGHRRLAAAGLDVDVGLCVDEARRAHAGHIRRIQDGRPHVTLKLALSSDGKVALAGRKPVKITGDMAQRRVHMMRAMSDAILVGIGTVIADDPSLTCRLPGMQSRSPVRVVLDSDLRLPPDSMLARSARDVPVWIVTGPNSSGDRAETLRSLGVEVITAPVRDNTIDLGEALETLAGRGITRLMVEGGPTIAASFVLANLVDEAVLFQSPTPIGADGVGALEGLPLEALVRSPHLRACATDPIGGDRMTFFERV